MIRQVVISAGGRGERLRPLTETIPKVMIPLAGKPLLEHHIRQFKKHGVTEFFLTLNYLPEKITDYFGDGAKWGVKIFYYIERDPLGDMGGVRTFKDKLHDNFFFVWGDMYSEVDYLRLADYFFKHPGAVGAERVAEAQHKNEADFVGLDKDMKLTALYPKGGPSPAGVAYRLRGSAVFSKNIFHYFPEEGPFYKKDLLYCFLEHHEAFYGYECDDYSKGIDTMEKYREVEQHLRL